MNVITYNHKCNQLKSVFKAKENNSVYSVLLTLGRSRFGYDLFGFNKNGLYILVGMLGGKFEVQLPLMTFSSRTLKGVYLGSIKEMAELMELVKAGKIEPVPVETRHISKVNDTILHLKEGKIKGLVSLIH